MDWKIKKTITLKKALKRRQQIIQTVLESRDIKDSESDEFLNPTNPLKIKPQAIGLKSSQLKKTVKRIKKAIKDKQPIFIYGDYDTDGICATAILWEALYHLGAQVLPFIPHREKHGYGIKKIGIKEILEHEACLDKKPLIITVDNGITAHQAVKFAKKNDLEIIVTDHHQPGKKLPPAYSVVYSTQVAGAGVAWFLAKEIIKDEKKLKSLLELAAVGTISDMMPLVKINRSLVKWGLKTISQTKRTGLKAIFKQANISGEIQTYHLSFMVAPRLNAAGRLKSALDALRLVCTTDPVRAQHLAQKLGKINYQRQQMTQDILNHANQLAKSQKNLILAVDPSYHPGVVGLVAGKLVEKYYRPTLVLAQEDEVSRGSARSIKEVNIIKLLRQFEDLFVDLGGHPMAAGFTIKTKNLPKLEKKLNSWLEKNLDLNSLKPTLNIDCQIKLDDITNQLFQELEKLNPFGIGNPRPVFSTQDVKVAYAKAVGSQNNHLKLRFKQGQKIVEAIGFGFGNLAGKLKQDQTVKVAYTIDENHFNGKTTLQMKLKDLKT